MKALKICAIVFGMFVTMPISFYITYSLIVAVHGDRLLFFLFWLNLPLTMFLSIIFKVIETYDKDKKG
jgi:nitric oxide reductase large subunit